MSSENPLRLLLPPELRQFELSPEQLTKLETKPVGDGTFGTVWKGIYEDKDGNVHKVAIKYMHQFSTKDAGRSFVREISTIVCINHPAILPLVGFIPDANEPVVVHKFMSNGSLESLRLQMEKKNGRFPPGTNAARLAITFYGVAHAMACLHANHVIHRDLKPANIFLGEKHRPYVGDFGCARFLSENEDLSLTAAGTLVFMAPEIMTGTGVYTNKVDVYSFGVTIWAMFQKGKWTLEDGRDVMNMSALLFMQEILKGKRFSHPKEMPDCYWDLVCECWSPDADARPTFAEIVRKMQTPEFASWQRPKDRDQKEYEAYQQELAKFDELMVPQDPK